MAVDLNVNIKGQGIHEILQQAKERELDADYNKADPEELARKKLAQKITVKKDRLKHGDLQKESFSREKAVNEKMQQIMGGAAGPEAAEALKDWEGNKDIQKKLTDAQKHLFREAMAKNPPKATRSAKVINNLIQNPETGRAIKTSQQMGILQNAVIDNPEVEKQAGEILKNRFMQSPKSDPQAKGRFMEFGLRQAGKGNMGMVKQAGDLLGTLSKGNIGKGGQRATMNMVQRNPDNPKPLSNVDAMVQDPNFSKMPNFARTKGTELAAKANGKEEVTEGFKEIAGNNRFKGQTVQNKGRFFSTIGTGRPSEYRAITDSLLTSLQHPSFPKRGGQVKKYLNEVSKQVTKGGAKGIRADAAMKKSKSSPMPQLTLVPMDPENMDEEEMSQARSQNRANVMQFYNKLSRMYEGGEKKLKSAKYLEDVNQLQTLRPPPEPDLSVLTPEEQAFLQERRASVMKRYNVVSKLQRQRSRELRTKRRRGGKKGLNRSQGKQPRYFSPKAMRSSSASEAFLQAAANQGRKGLPATPQRGGMATRGSKAQNAGSNIQQQVESALANLGNGPMTADRAGMVAQVIAAQVAQQVAQQVAESLLGSVATSHLEEDGMAPDEAPLPGQTNKAKKSQKSEKSVVSKKAPRDEQAQKGKVDGWGIPRTFERDLGGAQREVVRPPVSEGEQKQSFAEAVAEKYTGKVLIKDPASIRDVGALFAAGWKHLNKAEKALLKNLGWNQQMWDTKDTRAAKWPAAMMTAFVNLLPVQREAIRKLGFTPHEWDKKVQAFTGGKDA